MEFIPVICDSFVYWRAFKQNYLLDKADAVSKGWVRIQDTKYFYIPSSDHTSLYGLRLKKAIIYRCFPDDRFMSILESRFYELEPNIDIIWDEPVEYEIDLG